MVGPSFTWLKHQAAASWHRSQIGHRSEYSIERLLAFRDYYERTSISRVLAICVFSPVPALLAAIVIDCIPLKSPSEGWQANYAVWIRLTVAMTTEALGVVFQVRAVVEPGTISIVNAVKIALGTAISTVLVAMMLAALWKFPTPFGYVLAVTPFVLFFSIFTVMAMSPALTRSPVLRQQFKSQICIVANQGAVAICYPIFSAIFNRLSRNQQTAFIFVMPMIKFLAKQNIANAAEIYREYAGPVVVFSVDLFNVYYVAICMQASKSIATTLVIMATDSFHVVLAVRAIFQRKIRVQTSRGPTAPIIEQPENYLHDLPAQIRGVFKDSMVSNAYNQRIRLFAPFPLHISDESEEVMSDLVKTNRFTSDRVSNRRCSSKDATKRHSGSESARSSLSMPTISALKRHQIVPADPTRSDIQTLVDNREKAIYDALQALFHSEYVLLAEYIEFMVPMLYAFYLAVIYHLPVAAYYPHTESMTAQKLEETVTNVLIYAALEFVEFGALLIVLKRKFGFFPLYQLAFALETQALVLQCHLFVWTITILHLTLAHYGTPCLSIEIGTLFLSFDRSC